MSREIRMVPEGWTHPKRTRDDRYIPLFGGSWLDDLVEWRAGKSKWDEGLKDDYSGGWKPLDGTEDCTSFAEWYGEKPDIMDYMPQWEEDEKTHLCMYETTSEGTPVSPLFLTPEELARWLADNKASSFGDRTASYEQWLGICKGGWAPSAVHSSETGLISGVEFLAEN